ncbi:hypothetical protein X740_27955 [Mesorhizobium sp. LNHC221B00]|nr:hypothetical protein X740_27955 [Mesorhizobium sp. LNHC221B00]
MCQVFENRFFKVDHSLLLGRESENMLWALMNKIPSKV